MRHGLARLCVAALALGAASAPSAVAQDSWSYDLSRELMSPFCPGRTLASCPSDKATELMVWVRLQETAGASREEVEAELVARFGEQVLPAPPPRDLTAIAGYAVPILALVAGGPLVFFLLRRLAAPGPAASPAAAAGAPLPAAGSLDDDLVAEVERELRERDA